MLSRLVAARHFGMAARARSRLVSLSGAPPRLAHSTRGEEEEAASPAAPPRTESELVSLLRSQRPLRRTEVLAAVRELRENGQLRTQRHYTIAISALGTVRESGAAAAMLDEMRAAELTPNMFTYSALVTAHGRAGDWRRALALVRRMATDDDETPAPDAGTFKAAIMACVRNRAWHGVLEMLREARAAGVAADIDVKHHTAGLDALARTGQGWEAARDMLRSMEGRI